MTKFGHPRQHLVSCGSTNDAARVWAINPDSPAPSGALVTADFQTRGRGQRGHEWQAQAGQNALMSFVYRLPPDAEPGQIGLLTATAVASGLHSLGFSTAIKWPNDILLGGKKCAGILVEVTADAAILGIGINVNQTDFPDGETFAYPPTSLRLASGREQPIEEVVLAVGRFLTYQEGENRRDRTAAVAYCRARLAKGATVRQGGTSATLIGLTDSGAAVVCLPDGTFAVWTTVS